MSNLLSVCVDCFVTLIVDGSLVPDVWESFQDVLFKDILATQNRRHRVCPTGYWPQACLPRKLQRAIQPPKGNAPNNGIRTRGVTDAFNPSTQLQWADDHQPMLTSEQATSLKHLKTAVESRRGKPFCDKCVCRYR